MTKRAQPDATRVDEIGDGIDRRATRVDLSGGMASGSNESLVDDEALPFHAGRRRLFPAS